MRLIGLGLLVLVLTGCDQIKTAAATDNKVEIEEIKAQATQNQVNAEFQKRIQTIQLAVADACVKRGGVPIFTNGNIDCKLTK